MPRLIVTDSEGEVTEHEIGAGATSMGRSSKCNVVLLDAQASRIHAIVEYDGRTLTLHDQESHNGTWLNGERVEEAELVDGDMMRIGETSVKLVVEEAPASGSARQERGKVGRKPAKKWSAGKKPADAKPPREKPVFREPPTEVVPALMGHEDEDKAETEEGAAEIPAERKRPTKRSRRESARSTVDRPAPRKRGKRSAHASKKRGGPSTDGEAAPARDDAADVREGAGTTRRSRQVLGGMRLNRQQQNMVKIVSAAVSFVCLIGIVWLIANMGGDSGRQGRRIVTDERAEPERLAEEARALAQQANAAENSNDTAEAYRLLCDAKDKMERANQLWAALVKKHPGKGFEYLEKKGQMFATQAKGIREQHFRVGMQLDKLRREGKLR
jgi:hypothetical protein